MTPDIESQEEVLGEILTRAASNHLAKKVIGAYVPGKSYNINYQNIKSFDAAHQEAAASFFGFTVRGESDKKLYKNLKILSDRILLKIESFFEILCNDCEETYRNTLDCAPVFTCRICMQGSHTCAKVTQRAAAYEAVPVDMRMTGMSWLCSECHRKNDLTITPKNDVTSTSQKPGEVEKVDADKKEVKEDVKSIPPPKPKEEDICKDYLKKRCAHGISGKKLVEGNPCPKAHPPPCRRYLNHGTDEKRGCRLKKDDCPYVHLNICRGSLKNRVCSKVKTTCPFIHLQKTRAKPREEDTQVEHTQRKSRLESTSSRHRPRRDSTSRRRDKTPGPAASNSRSTSAFLEQRLEEMKAGIIAQIAGELKSTLPSLIMSHLRPGHLTHKDTTLTHPPMTLGAPTPAQYRPHPLYPGYFC